MWSQQYSVTFLKPSNFIGENWDTEVTDLLKVAVTTFLPILPLMLSHMFATGSTGSRIIGLSSSK